MQGNGGGFLFWMMTLLAGVSLILVVVDGGLFLVNQTAQGEVNQRQLFINQTTQLGRVQETLVRALATSAVNNKDDQLRDLLAQHGISYTVNQAPGNPAPGSQTPATPPAADAAAPKN